MASDADLKIIQEAIDHHRQACEAEDVYRPEALEDLRFCVPGNQWDAADKAKRQQQKRPTLEIDRTNPFVKQIINEIRNNRSAIKIDPIDDGGDKETAEVLQGLVRNIEYSSNADAAYDHASDFQVKCGFGFLRVLSDYASPESFEQELKIARVHNPFSVHLDPAYTEPDASDMRWALIDGYMSFEDLEAEYPKAEGADTGGVDMSSVGDTAPGWVDKDGRVCRVCEYFKKEFKKVHLYRYPDGSVKRSDQIEGDPEPNYLSDREAQIPTIKWYKLTAFEILEQEDLDGQWIPIVPVFGDEANLDGQRYYFGLVRPLREVQRLYNHWKSCQAEIIGMAPKAPWIGPKGFMGTGKQKKAWESANTETYAALEYDVIDQNGKSLPPPSRDIQEPAVQAITLALQQTEVDFKAVSGIFDPSLGNRSESGQSGIAIGRLQQQGRVGNYHFQDNQNRAKRHLGRILIDLIPYKYDSPRIIRIIGEDEGQKTVQINSQTPPEGQKKVFNLKDAGKYDVTVSSGPSYTSKRQENMAILMDLLKAMPQLGQIGADLIISQLDAPITDKFVERIKKTLDPKLVGDDMDQSVPPQLKQILDKSQQMISDLSQHLNAANDELESKNKELASKERCELYKVRANLIGSLIQISSAEAKALAEQEIEQVNARLDLLGQEYPLEEQQQPEAGAIPPDQMAPQPPAGAQPPVGEPYA